MGDRWYDDCCRLCPPPVLHEPETARLNREIRALRIRVAELEVDAAKARLSSLRRAGV